MLYHIALLSLLLFTINRAELGTALRRLIILFLQSENFIWFYLEWMDLVQWFTKYMMGVFGVKERTARGYAVDCASVRYLYLKNEEQFLRRKHPWDEFVNVNKSKFELIELIIVIHRILFPIHGQKQ